jgi:hypothetical protein
MPKNIQHPSSSWPISHCCHGINSETRCYDPSSKANPLYLSICEIRDASDMTNAVIIAITGAMSRYDKQFPTKGAAQGSQSQSGNGGHGTPVPSGPQCLSGNADTKDSRPTPRGPKRRNIICGLLQPSPPQTEPPRDAPDVSYLSRARRRKSGLCAIYSASAASRADLAQIGALGRDGHALRHRGMRLGAGIARRRCLSAGSRSDKRGSAPDHGRGRVGSGLVRPASVDRQARPAVSVFASSARHWRRRLWLPGRCVGNKR